jgi:hypothetical protein
MSIKEIEHEIFRLRYFHQTTSSDFYQHQTYNLTNRIPKSVLGFFYWDQGKCLVNKPEKNKICDIVPLIFSLQDN